MLQTLCDFYLLLSNDCQKITNKDLSIFYNFIIKKIPQIEQQYPNIVLKSLSKINEVSSLKFYENKKQICLNELKNNNEPKKTIFDFQKQLLDLFNDLIYFFYIKGIIKLNNKLENKMKEKINEIYKSNEIDKKNLKEVKIEEITNFLKFLTIKEYIQYSINPSNFVNFFNGENKSKKIYCVVQFMTYIESITKIYKENKNKIKYKISNTEKKTSEGEKQLIYKERNNNTEGKKNNSKNNCNESKNNSTGRKGNKTDNIKIKNMKYRNISDKHIFNTEHKLESYKKKTEREKLIKDIKLSTKGKEIVINNDDDKDNDNIKILDESENEVNDTVRCETLKNAYQDIEVYLNNNKNIYNKFCNRNEGRCLFDKNKSNNKIRLTISNISLFEQKLKSKQKKAKTNQNSPKVLYHSSTQKKKFGNRNINSIKGGIFGLDHYSFEKKSKNKKNNNLKNEKIKNKVDNIKNQEIKNENIIKKENIEKNKINKDINNNKQSHNNKYETIFNDKYNLVSKVKKDNNNNLFKESFLYKNLEVHQHSVIFNDNEKKEKENEDDDIAGCIIM